MSLERKQLECFLKNLIHSQQKKESCFSIKEERYSLGDLLLRKNIFFKKEYKNGKSYYYFRKINDRNIASSLLHYYWIKNYELKDFNWINPQNPPISSSTLYWIIVLHREYGYMTWEKAKELNLSVRYACILYF